MSLYLLVCVQLPYRLHAVLVHEGQASGGHYWAYIQDPKQQRWCKFNDITVSEVTWEEVSHESLGGYRHVSAYCLMYIDARREGCIDAGSAIQELPADLQELVDKDNVEFENELRDWDEKQLNKAAVAGKRSQANVVLIWCLKHVSYIFQGVKLRLIQAPVRLNFSLWRPNPKNWSPNWRLNASSHLQRSSEC